MRNRPTAISLPAALPAAALAALLTAALLAGCAGDSAEREKEIREGAAKAAEAAKPPLEEAGRDLKAAVEGAKEGWQRAAGKKLISTPLLRMTSPACPASASTRQRESSRAARIAMPTTS